MMDEFHMRSYIERLEKDRSKLLQKNVDLECEIVKLKDTVRALTETNEKLTKLFKISPVHYPKKLEEINTKPATCHKHLNKEDELTIEEIAKIYEDIKSGIGFLFFIIGVVCLLAILLSWMVERIDVIHPVIYGLVILSALIQVIVVLVPSKEYFKKTLRLHKSYTKNTK